MAKTIEPPDPRGKPPELDDPEVVALLHERLRDRFRPVSTVDVEKVRTLIKHGVLTYADAERYLEAGMTIELPDVVPISGFDPAVSYTREETERAIAEADAAFGE